MKGLCRLWKRAAALLWIVYAEIGKEYFAFPCNETDFYDDGFCLLCGNNAPWCKCEEWEKEIDAQEKMESAV